MSTKIKMAASIMKLAKLGSGTKHASQLTLRPVAICQSWTRTAFFRRKKDTEAEASAESAVSTLEDDQPVALSVTPHFQNKLRKREGLQTVRGYKPPTDVEARVQNIVSDVCGDVADLTSLRFDDTRMKFKILDKAMRDFDHYIPNSYLNSIQSVGDVVAFFSTPVRDTSAYEDLSTLDLPPNLHIQLEPVRFDPETDTMFGGKTAFPGRPTIVSSLKFKRKYGPKDK